MSQSLLDAKGYQQVPILEDGELEKSVEYRRGILSGSVSVTSCVLYCLLSVTTLGLSLAIGLQSPWLDDLCFRRHSSYSPATSHIDTSYHTTQFNGTLETDSVYKGRPRKEMDDAWSILEHGDLTYITSQELSRIPGNMDSIMMPPEADLPDTYLGTLEVFHQMHCLNWMRRASVWNYDHYKATPDFTDPVERQMMHYDHCVDIIRQSLLCHADVSIVTYKWVKGRKNPYPNFNNWHTCRNFDSVVEFARTRAVGEG